MSIPARVSVTGRGGNEKLPMLRQFPDYFPGFVFFTQYFNKSSKVVEIS